MQHPALKNFNTAWEAVKIVGSKALKWGAIAAITLAVLSPLSWLGAGIGGLVSLFSASAGSAIAGGALMSSLAVGGTIGAMLGAVKGVGGVSKALEEKKQDVIADYDQASVARERSQLMARASSRNMGGGGNVSPGRDYGRESQQQGVGIS